MTNKSRWNGRVSPTSTMIFMFTNMQPVLLLLQLSQRILQEGEPAVRDYLEFLSGGSSKDPVSLLRGAGVDMSTPQPVESALRQFGELVDELESLTAER